jgi:hypothetical protein
MQGILILCGMNGDAQRALRRGRTSSVFGVNSILAAVLKTD